MSCSCSKMCYEQIFITKSKRVFHLPLNWRSAYLNYLFTGIIGIFLFPSLSHAEIWKFEPRITLQERYDDNFKLESTAHDPVFESLLRGVVSFSRLSPTTKVEGRVHAKLSTQSKDNRHLTFSAQKNFELSQWQLDGFFRQDTTIRTSKDDQNVDEDSEQVADDVDEGQAQLELRRTTIRLKPKFTHHLSERTTLGIAYLFTDVSYKDNVASSGLFDYDQNGIAASIIRNLSERDKLTTILGLSRYRSMNEINTVADGVAFTVGYRRLLTEKMIVSMAVGLRRSIISSDDADSEENTFVVNMRLIRKFTRGRVSIEGVKDTQPTGSGGLIEKMQLKLNLKYQFKERLSGLINLKGFERKSIGRLSSNKSYFLTVTSSLRWNLNRRWSTEGGYNFRKREQVDSANDAYGNAVFVSLIYAK